VLHELDHLLVSRAPAVRAASSSSPRASRLLLQRWYGDATFAVDGSGRITGMWMYGNASGSYDLAPRNDGHFQT
jgi:hypothetical protein